MSETDQLIITCPSCGGRLRTTRDTIGTSVGCPSCEAAVPVRDPAAAHATSMIFDPAKKLGLSPRGENAATGDAAFKEKLRSTTDTTLQVDPDHPP